MNKYHLILIGVAVGYLLADTLVTKTPVLNTAFAKAYTLGAGQ